MIKVSIIIPVYNTAEYLMECFHSVFSQTLKEIAIIAVNDGSTDHSLDILNTIKKEHPEMIIISQENKGLGAVRNKGIELATGKYIYFLDSDDCLAGDAMDICYRYAEKNQSDVLMFDAETFGEIDQIQNAYNRSEIITDKECVLKGEVFAGKYWLKSFCPSACLIFTSAQFLRRHKLQFRPGVYYEDNEFYIRMMLLAERVIYIPKMLYRRRCREGSIIMSPFDMHHVNDYLQMIQAVQALDREIHSSRLRSIIQELKLNFLTFLLSVGRVDGMFENKEFAERFYRTLSDVCGEASENKSSYRSLLLLDEMGMVLPDDIMGETERAGIKNKKREWAERIWDEIPFCQREKCIGIYGTGKTTDQLLEACKNCQREIKAKLIFIDSNIASGEVKYKGQDVIHIDDIGKLSLECIVIASVKYEEEMYQMVQEKYGDRFRLIRIKADLHF